MQQGSRTVLGIGINDAGYPIDIREPSGEYQLSGRKVMRTLWKCPFYARWAAMIERGYSDVTKRRFPSYTNVSVSSEWHRFSTFKAWMEALDWEGRELDKDILFPGNQVYGPATCCFVSGAVNRFITEATAARGELPVGVTWYIATQKFVARVCAGGLKVHLGYYLTPEEAFHAWLKAKREFSLTIADDEPDPRVKPAIIARYANYPIPDFSQYPTREEMIARDNPPIEYALAA